MATQQLHFVLKAADEILANTPEMVALAKAEALGRLWQEEPDPQPGVPFYQQPTFIDDKVVIPNEPAMRAYEEMIRASVALAAAREKHLRALRQAEEIAADVRDWVAKVGRS